MAALARSAVSTPLIRSTVSRDDATMCARPTMMAKAAPSAKFALRGDFLKGHASVSASRTASVVAERTALRISCGESRVGKLAVPLPKGVDFKISGKDVTIKGKLGEMKYTLPSVIEIEEQEGQLRIVKTDGELKKTKALHGLARALVNNMVVGVSEGFTKQLDLVGVGYRAAMQGKNIQLSLGFSHPVIMTPPEGITVKVEGNTKVFISGYDKCEVGNFAAIIRALRPPEPYKGKGVKYHDETILRKEGKSGK